MMFPLISQYLLCHTYENTTGRASLNACLWYSTAPQWPDINHHMVIWFRNTKHTLPTFSIHHMHTYTAARTVPLCFLLALHCSHFWPPNSRPYTAISNSLLIPVHHLILIAALFPSTYLTLLSTRNFNILPWITHIPTAQKTEWPRNRLSWTGR